MEVDTVFSSRFCSAEVRDMRIAAEWAWGTGVCLYKCGYVCVCVHSCMCACTCVCCIGPSISPDLASYGKNRIYTVLWLMQLAGTDIRKHSPACMVSILQKSDVSHCFSFIICHSCSHEGRVWWLSQTEPNHSQSSFIPFLYIVYMSMAGMIYFLHYLFLYSCTFSTYLLLFFSWLQFFLFFYKWL